MVHIKILRRLIAVDAALAGDGLHVESFALQWNLDPMSIRRDLYALREMGQDTELWKLEDGTYRHCYTAGTRPLFTCNLKRSQ